MPERGQATMTLRFAERKDVSVILGFIRALAEYEHMADQITTDEALLSQQIFDRKGAEVLFVEEEGNPVGFALFCHNFSTFLGRRGLWLEDLFVLPEHRGKGIIDLLSSIREAVKLSVMGKMRLFGSAGVYSASAQAMTQEEAVRKVVEEVLRAKGLFFKVLHSLRLLGTKRRAY